LEGICCQRLAHRDSRFICVCLIAEWVSTAQRSAHQPTAVTRETPAQASHDRKATITAGESAIHGQCTSPADPTQAPAPSTNGAVGGRLHARVGPHTTWPVTLPLSRGHHVALRAVCESVVFRLPARRAGAGSFTPLLFTAWPTDRRGAARGAPWRWSRRCPLLPAS
jgi:hypothetical protein